MKEKIELYMIKDIKLDWFSNFRKLLHINCLTIHTLHFEITVLSSYDTNTLHTTNYSSLHGAKILDQELHYIQRRHYSAVVEGPREAADILPCPIMNPGRQTPPPLRPQHDWPAACTPPGQRIALPHDGRPEGGYPLAKHCPRPTR